MKPILKIFITTSLATPVIGFLLIYVSIMMFVFVPPLSSIDSSQYNVLLAVLAALVSALIIGPLFYLLKIPHLRAIILLSIITLFPLPGLYEGAARILTLDIILEPIWLLAPIFVGMVYGFYYVLLNQKRDFKIKFSIGFTIALTIAILIYAYFYTVSEPHFFPFLLVPTLELF